jgi:hypothetical protein
LRGHPPASEKSFLSVLVLTTGNNLSKASIWVDVKFPVQMTSYAPLDAGEAGATGGAIPILCLSSTSPRLEVGICDSGWAAIRLLLIGRGRFVTAFCRVELAIKGDCLLHCTSSVNLARRRAASRGMGVMSPSLTSSCPTQGGVSYGSSCTTTTGKWLCNPLRGGL